MKTTNFFLIVALITFGAMVFSQEATNKIKVERIALERAMQNKTICKAMYKQLDIKKVLHGEPVKYYTAIVKANDHVYLVYGKYMEWLNFFYHGKIVPPGIML